MEVITSKRRTIPETSIDATMLYERLKDTTAFETVSYLELSKLIGRDVQRSARSVMETARRICERDKILFGAVRGIGLQRLDSSGIINTGDMQLKRIRNAAKRGQRRILSADYDDLTNEAKIKHNAYASLFGVLHSITKPEAIKKVEFKVSEVHEKLPLGKTLEVFR